MKNAARGPHFSCFAICAVLAPWVRLAVACGGAGRAVVVYGAPGAHVAELIAGEAVACVAVGSGVVLGFAFGAVAGGGTDGAGFLDAAEAPGSTGALAVGAFHDVGVGAFHACRGVS